MAEQMTAPQPDPLAQSLFNLAYKHADTKAKVDAAKTAEADFEAHLEQHIQQIRERFKL